MDGTTAQELRERVMAWTEGKQRWRERRAEAYPQDNRNARSAAGYADLGLYVALLSDADPGLSRIFAAGGAEWAEITIGEDDNKASGQFRFFDPDESCDLFFTKLVAMMCHDVNGG